MTMPIVDEVEERAAVLAGEIEKLERAGLPFAASLVRIAHLDLLMRLHNVDREEIDVLNFAINAVEQERRSQSAKVSLPSETETARNDK